MNKMITKFTAIDFETATPTVPNICQIGIVQFENGNIIQEINILVKPLRNYYWKNFTEIHGITSEDTVHAADFDVVWKTIAPFIEHQIVVAHNGLCFDFPVLEKTLTYYNLPIPQYEKYDTRRIYNKGLADLCAEHEIQLHHHDALSDARACGILFMKHLTK